MVQRVTNQLQQLARHFPGELAVAAHGLGPMEKAPTILWQGDESFPPASIIKVPILITCLRLVAHGEIALNTRVTLQEEHQVLGAGILRDCDAGLHLTVHDLLTLMIVLSDNTATNMVIDLVGGPDTVNDDLQRFGCSETWLAGKLMLPPMERQAMIARRGVSRTTARDMLHITTQLAAGRLLPTEMTQTAHRIMYRQRDTAALTRILPWPETHDTPPWQLAAKSGAVNGVRNQVGWLMQGDMQFSFVVLTKNSGDARFSSENRGHIAISQAFRIVYDYFYNQAILLDALG